MRIAALYDIHGNLPALEAVLAEVHRLGVDHIVVGGDVLPGPLPRESLTALLGLEPPASFIMGNGDREALTRMRGLDPETLPPAVRDALRWNARQLDPEHAGVIAGWPATLRLAVDGIGDVIFCHATPRNDVDIFTRLTADVHVRPAFDGVDADLVVCGHTHMQFDRAIGRLRVVNAGSVGMPLQDPGAYWLLLDGGVHLRRTDYDRRAAAQRVRATSYPQAEEFAATSILNPPREQDMIDRFASASLK